MDFKKLQEMQRALDNAILKEKPEMTAKERFEKTCVALSVEIAELANTAEHFKFWKENKGKKVEEGRFVKVGMLAGENNVLLHDAIRGGVISVEQAHKLTLVEEASDCLHFILSLANQLETELGGFNLVPTNSTIETAYLMIQLNISCMGTLDSEYSYIETLSTIVDWFYYYISKIGINTQELEQAYYDKNEVNYQRLREGY